MVRSLPRHEGVRLTIDFHPAAAGTTALGMACSQHRTEIANLLLQAGGDPYLFDSHGRTAVAIAKAWKYTDCIQLLQVSCLLLLRL